LEDFRGVVSDENLAEIYARARRLYGKHITHVNATYQGGGVAELLYPLVLLMNDVGINADWRILHGSQEFFEITKSFHNALQGAPLTLTERKKATYLTVNENFSKFAHLANDCVVVHDPQPLSLIRSYTKTQPWIWRCHIDLTQPHAELWDFLKGFLLKYDRVILSNDSYRKPDLPVEQQIIYPAINPMSDKNRDLPEKTILDHITRAGIPTDKPLLTQVSRLDPWKDPEGVIDVFKEVKKQTDCRLLFCYNAASDDPEGERMYKKVRRKAESLSKNGDVLFVLGHEELLVNSIQRYSSCVIQKSTREGFGLSVTEALWKATPVVASNVGGISLQIEDGKSGYLVEPDDVDGFAQRIVEILERPEDRRNIGHEAREAVREKFLITRLLSDYLGMLSELIGD